MILTPRGHYPPRTRKIGPDPPRTRGDPPRTPFLEFSGFFWGVFERYYGSLSAAGAFFRPQRSFPVPFLFNFAQCESFPTAETSKRAIVLIISMTYSLMSDLTLHFVTLRVGFEKTYGLATQGGM